MRHGMTHLPDLHQLDKGTAEPKDGTSDESTAPTTVFRDDKTIAEVCILEFEDGTVIHMLVKRRYPLSKDLLQRMLDLGLEVERESTVALDLIRFIKQHIDEE
ncbi:hypothetical protein Tco_0165030 [Tanacetum coccineum]